MKFPFDSINQSMITQYLDCPLAFKLIYIDELMQPESPALEIGSMFDKMFKAYHQKQKYPEFKDDENLRKTSKLMKAYELNPDYFVSPKFDIGFKVDLPGTDIKLRGTLDGLSDVEIIEVKTTSESYDQLRVDTAFQATAYTYGMYMTYKKMFPVRYVVINKKTYDIQRLLTTRTESDFQSMFTKIKSFIKGVEDEQFKVNENHQVWCACKRI